MCSREGQQDSTRGRNDQIVREGDGAVFAATVVEDDGGSVFNAQASLTSVTGGGTEVEEEFDPELLSCIPLPNGGDPRQRPHRDVRDAPDRASPPEAPSTAPSDPSRGAGLPPPDDEASTRISLATTETATTATGSREGGKADAGGGADVVTAPSTPTAIPRSFYCPITMSVMRDPVADYEGNTYEREAITAWLSRHGTSPVTRKPLRFRHLAPNRALGQAIAERMRARDGGAWSSPYRGGRVRQWLGGDYHRGRRTAENSGPPGDARQTSPQTTLASRKVSSSSLSPEQLADAVVDWDFSVSLPSAEHRATIDTWLMDIGNAVGRTYRLDNRGKVCFSFDGLILAIEVPEKSSYFFIYTALVEVGRLSNPTRVKEEALKKNHFPRETLGGSLSLKPETNEIFYCYSQRIPDINSTGFKIIIENFIHSSVRLRRDLVEVSSSAQSMI